MATDSTSTRRRGVLKLTGGSFAAVGTTGTSATARVWPFGRHVVGLAADADFDVAAARANSVYRKLDFGHVGKAVVGEFSTTTLWSLATDPEVRYVEADGQKYALGTNKSWSIDRIDADVVGTLGETGHGIDIAVVDTGIDSDHPDLEPNVGEGRAYVECRGSPRDCRHPWDDDNGHGTLCTGIVKAIVDPGNVDDGSDPTMAHAVKALDNRGVGSFSDVAAGIEWTVDRDHDVANLSLGSHAESNVVRDAGRYAYDEGVLLVAAAGNDGPCSDCVTYPAAYPEFLAVSATACDDSLADFSSTGPEVDVAAPGVDVYSTTPGGYDTASGTSLATAHVTGIGARLMADGYTNEEIRDRLTGTAEDVGLDATEQGSGLVDAAAAFGLDSSDDVASDGSNC